MAGLMVNAQYAELLTWISERLYIAHIINCESGDHYNQTCQIQCKIISLQTVRNALTGEHSVYIKHRGNRNWKS